MTTIPGYDHWKLATPPHCEPAKPADFRSVDNWLWILSIVERAINKTDAGLVEIERNHVTADEYDVCRFTATFEVPSHEALADLLERAAAAIRKAIT